MKRVLIIGGGQAATSCAFKLRALDETAEIAILGNEPALPYQRPPLSKGFVKGEVSANDLVLRSAEAYAEHRIDVHLGVDVVAVDRAAKTVKSSTGTLFEYDDLVFATGSRPRPLPEAMGGALPGVYMLRSLADAETLKNELSAAKRVVIVGGGYIGLEAAAVLSRLGHTISLVEASDRILQRVASERTSRFFRDLHRANGVELIEGVALQSLQPNETGAFSKAILDNGREIEADFALVGIGGIANSELAEQAGLETANGIRVDEVGRTSDPHVYACGDCAYFAFEGQYMRLESVQNAIEQAEIVAAAIAGNPSSYQPVPWFWSDQYEVKLQIAGLSTGFTRAVERKGKREGSLSVWYYKDEDLIAVDAMNDPQSYMLARRALKAKHSPPPERLEDASLELKAAVGL